MSVELRVYLETNDWLVLRRTIVTHAVGKGTGRLESKSTAWNDFGLSEKQIVQLRYSGCKG